MIMDKDKDLRLKALEELSRLDEELGWISDWPKPLEIDGFKLICTSTACPEQYDVFDAVGKKVGYLRLRHGMFRVDVPDCGGETIYRSYAKGDGTFEENERMDELRKAVDAIKSRINE